MQVSRTIHIGQVGDQAEVRPAASLCPYSRVLDTARVLGGSLRNTTIRDKARVYGGILLNCTVGIEATVTGGQIANSVIACDEVAGNPLIIESGLFDQSCCWDKAQLYRVEMREGARVYGDAQLRGNHDHIELHGDMRISSGIWTRAPRYVHLGFCFLTEGPAGFVMIDCKLHEYSRWFRAGERYARRWYGWGQDRLDQVREVLTEWQAEPIPM